MNRVDLQTFESRVETWLRRIPVRQRIFLLLGLTLAVLCLLLGLTWRYHTAEESFHRQIEALVRQGIDLQQVKGDSERLQGLIRQYLARPEPAIQEHVTALAGRLDRGLVESGARLPGTEAPLAEARTAMQALVAAFAKLVSLNPEIVRTYETEVLKAGRDASGLFAIINGSLIGDRASLLSPSLGRAHEAFIEAMLNLNVFYLRPDPASSDQARQSLARVVGAVPVMTDLGTSELQRNALRALGERVGTLEHGLEQLVSMFRKQADILGSGVDANAGKLSGSIDALLALNREHQAQLQAEYDDRQAATLAVLLALGLAVVVAGAGMSWMIAQSIRRPLIGLMGSVQALAAGDLDADVGERSQPDEVGALARTLQDFRGSMAARREAETALRLSEERYRNVIEHATEGIIVIQDGRFALANPATVRMVGLSEHELVGRSFAELIHPEDRATVVERYMRRMRGEIFESRYEFRVCVPTDQVIWVALSVVMIQWNNRPATLSFVSDITERKRLEDSLTHALAELEAMLQNTLVGVTHTVDRHHRWVNSKFAELTGFEPGELIGKSGALHFPDEESWLRFGTAAYPVLERGEPVLLEWQVRRKDGTLFWAEIFAKNVDPTDLSKGTIWTFLDISARRKAEDDIRAALDKQRELNLLKSRFVSMTSHEFRTPLSAILSSAQLLRLYGERLPADERRDLTVGIESAVKRMARMLDDILLIGRAEAGALEFAPAKLDLGALCRALIDESRAADAAENGGSHRIECIVRGDATHPVLDEKLLRHILGNLLSNAVKYSPQGGRVSLEVECEPRQVRFAVADEGIGIAPEDLPKLFETFVRASNVGTISGTGLGLAIVKRAVELHGGTIEVESVPDRGSCFRVTLPCPDA